ncbi:MAG TPA: response regulator [Thermoanaerobaculia bacterium]
MTETTRRARPAVFRLYALLAAFYLLTMGVMVYLHYRLAALHERSVKVNDQWSRHALRVDDLALLAGHGDALAFRALLADIELDLRREAPGHAAELAPRFRDMHQRMNLASVIALRRDARNIQARELTVQSGQRARIRHANSFLVGLTLFTLVGAIFYGRRLLDERQFVIDLEGLNAKLKESEDRFTLASRATSDVIWDWNIVANTLELSSSLITRYGYPQAGKMDMNFWYEAMHPEDRERVGASLHRALDSGEDRWSDDYRFRRYDGSYAWVFDRGTILREHGKPLRMIGAILDMTERVEAELEVSRLSRQNEMILQSAADGIFGIDINGETIFVNESAAAMLGFTTDEMKRGRMHQLVHHSHEDGSPYAWNDCPAYHAVQRGVETSTASDTFWRRDGTAVAVEYSSRPMYDDLGELVGAVVTFRDVSERRAIEKMKDEFVSIVSHELRTPLTSIRGALGLLAGGRLGELPEKAHRMLDIAVSNTDRLVRLINDILDIERMESGKITLSRQICDTRELLEQVADVMRPMAERAQIHLEVDACDVTLYADSDRLVQTLTNLVSNAVKFSGAGTTITLSAHAEAELVTFDVADEGRGIPSEKLDAIFERFQQVDASDSREKGGSGLGLAICRSIVRQHGGEIWAESEMGHGSRFRFTVPRISATAQPKTAATPGRTILICDDDPSVREVMTTLLTLKGYAAEAFASGEELLERADFANADAILLDLVMPGLNGWQTLAALKDRSDAASVPVVIVSVLSPEAVGGGAQSAPPAFDGWVQKPCEERTLVTALEHAMGGSTPNRRARVLLVEDDHDLARVIAASFDRHGIDVVHAASGAEAIDHVQKSHPDLLVLDLVLPGIDGFGVVDWLKDHALLQRVPLVVYSADEPTPSQRERLRLGPTEFLTKSRVSPDEFEMRVVQLLDTMTGKGEIAHVA